MSVDKGVRNAKLTGIFNDRTNPDCYLKVTTPPSGYFVVAVKAGVSSVAGLGSLPSPAINNAFKIWSWGKNTFQFFNIYLIPRTPGSKVSFTATEVGPFVVAGSFDVGFKENTALANKKLYHRADHLDEVLVCAHRGIWNQLGDHRLLHDFSGIAENTIPAYEKAIENPYVDWIEFDARRTFDGVFIAFHDESLHRVTNFADDADCFTLEEVNLRNKLWRKAPEQANTNWVFEKGRINDLVWEVKADGIIGDETKPAIQQLKASGMPAFTGIKTLILRDYLGCKVKDSQGNFTHPIRLEDAMQWLANQPKKMIISVDYKDGVKHLDELYRLILQYNLEGQILLSVYAKESALEDYQAQYGKDFLRQIPLKPTFYEPDPNPNADPSKNYGGDVQKRVDNYLKAEGHTLVGITININYDGDQKLIEIVNKSDFNDISNRMWVLTHYMVPFMSSVVDNNNIVSPSDCDPALHPSWETCPNLFWRGDFDWSLNNGTTAFFSDDVESLVEYLIAKGKKTRQ